MIDTHAHLCSPQFDRDRDAVIRRAQDAGVEAIVEVGYDVENSRCAVELAAKYPFIYAAVGVHPHDADKTREEDIDTLETLLAEPKVIAVGETGLDFYRNLSSPRKQEWLFQRLIALATFHKKPLIIHSRNSWRKVVEVIRTCASESLTGVFHCFPEGVQETLLADSLGFSVGLGGSFTYGRRERDEVIKRVKPGKLLLETDCPYLAPAGHRGKRNEPSYLAEILATISQLRGESTQMVEKVTTENARTLFGLD